MLIRETKSDARFTGLVIALLLVLLIASPTSAAPIFSPVSGSLQVTGLFPFGGLPTLDIRGAALFAVSDVALPPTPLYIMDSTGGQDPTGSVLPFGNNQLLAFDNVSASGFITFDFPNLTVNGSILTVPGSLFIPSSFTPAGSMVALATVNPLFYQFQQTAFQDLGGSNFLAQWGLTGIQAPAIPEPASFAMLFGGGVILTLVGYRRRRR